MDLKSPKELEILGNLSETGSDSNSDLKFIWKPGENAIDIYNNFKFDKEEDKYNLDIILKKIKDYCDPLKIQL
ncbi:hypothetical protein LAZ67_23000817 [Cordylochernes scorpioides]|uniref:Uncharacterized protein n=1 Tax=Cordylochernes scorpioides TaxID=51811 RepID=A0ABY6LS44_9ARAC|nr:hypothetical protein LAZ67_23000817 [Cordylochernes scorpioides]